MFIIFPNAFTVDELRAGNRIRQIGERTLKVEGTFNPFTQARLQGFLFRPNDGGEETLVIPKAKQLTGNHARVIEATVSANGTVNLRNDTWFRHPLQSGFRGGTFDYAREIQKVLDSWSGAFSYVQEDLTRGIQGL